jgi:hypothetical protein
MTSRLPVRQPTAAKFARIDNKLKWRQALAGDLYGSQLKPKASAARCGTIEETNEWLLPLNER